MVLVGNKCDLQAWAVDMSQARDVSQTLLTLLRLALMHKFQIHFCRLQNSMECRLSKHQPKREWESTMHSTR